MEPSQPVERDSKPLDVQFAFDWTAIFAPIRMIEDQLAALVARNGIVAGDPGAPILSAAIPPCRSAGRQSRLPSGLSPGRRRRPHHRGKVAGTRVANAGMGDRRGREHPWRAPLYPVCAHSSPSGCGCKPDRQGSNNSSAPVFERGTKPSSSMISNSWLASCLCRRKSRFSSWASMSSCTITAAVAKRVLMPRWHAATPRAMATWDLPTPLGPSAMTFSCRSTKSERARSTTSFLLSVGIASKPKLSRLLIEGNLAALMRRSTMRASRSISSNSIKRARYRT